MLKLKSVISSLISFWLIVGYVDGNGRCVASIGGACPPSWSHWGDNCYKVTERIKWVTANEECIKMRSVFVVPQSEEEDNYLVSRFDTHFWINCNDRQSEGMWNCLRPI